MSGSTITWRGAEISGFQLFSPIGIYGCSVIDDGAEKTRSYDLFQLQKPESLNVEKEKQTTKCIIVIFEQWYLCIRW